MVGIPKLDYRYIWAYLIWTCYQQSSRLPVCWLQSFPNFTVVDSLTPLRMISTRAVNIRSKKPFHNRYQNCNDTCEMRTSHHTLIHGSSPLPPSSVIAPHFSQRKLIMAFILLISLSPTSSYRCIITRIRSRLLLSTPHRRLSNACQHVTPSLFTHTRRTRFTAFLWQCLWSDCARIWFLLESLFLLCRSSSCFMTREREVGKCVRYYVFVWKKKKTMLFSLVQEKLVSD